MSVLGFQNIDILQKQPKNEIFEPKVSGMLSVICLGGLNFFSFQGALTAQHMLGPENPLKSIDFTGLGGFTPPPDKLMAN